MEDAEYDDFGFVIVRLDCSDEEKWARFGEVFDEPIDREVAECTGGDRIADKLLLPLVEDKILDRRGF